jgi:hypothetical protein
MAITHDNLAVQAFKEAHGRPPKRSLNIRHSPDEAWIANWKAEHVKRLCRQEPEYAHYHALLTTRRNARRTRLRLKAATRTPNPP